jgi:hypothetical protein
MECLRSWLHSTTYLARYRFRDNLVVARQSSLMKNLVVPQNDWDSTDDSAEKDSPPGDHKCTFPELAKLALDAAILAKE